MLLRTVGITIVFAMIGACGCSGDNDPGYVDAGLARDQCLSTTDMEIVLSSRTDAGLYDPLHEAKLCALSMDCYALSLNNQTEEAYTCIHACLDGMPSGALSTGCRDCYAFEGSYCASVNCLIPCLGDDVSLCTACFDEYCRARLDTCIGY